MSHILSHYKGKFDVAVGFSPSGLGFSPSAARGRSSGGGRRRQKGSLVLYQIPYSEHSSFDELREMVAWLRPGCVTPTVGNTDACSAAAMVRLLLPPEATVVEAAGAAAAAPAAAGGIMTGPVRPPLTSVTNNNAV